MSTGLLRNLEILAGLRPEPLRLSAQVYDEALLLTAARDLGLDAKIGRAENGDFLLAGVPEGYLDRLLNAALLGHGG